MLKCVYRERAAISLFDALNANSTGPSGPLTFPESTIAEVSQTLARFRSIAVDDYGVPLSQISVFATEAMRRAANAGAILDAIKTAAPGLSVQILAPEVETLFGAMGARSGFVAVKGLFLDLGGGSVQMTYMDSSSDVQPSYEIAAAQAGESLPFGAARLIRVLETASADVKAIEEAKLSTGMARAFSVLKEKFPSLAETGHGEAKDGVDVYLCGGGFRGYGSILMHNDPIQPYPIPSVGAYTVSGDLFKDTKTMRKLNAEYEGKIFGMSKRRRHQFPAIATVIEALVQAVPNIKSVTFCAGGNREGALVLKLPRDIRERNPLPLLASVDAKSDFDSKTTETVLDSLLAAIPSDRDLSRIPSIFSLGLAPLFAREIWARSGEDDDSNAAHALHNAVHGYPSSPGLTHLARAVLGLTLCARWGGGLAPINMQLHHNLKALVERADPEASFWAEYIGASAAALARVISAWPAGRSVIDIIRYAGLWPNCQEFTNERLDLKPR